MKTVLKKKTPGVLPKLPSMLVGRTVLIYSQPKVGKSTFADALVRRYGGTVLDYDRERLVKDIEGPVVVIDTLTSMATHELDRTTKRQGVEVLGDISWGRGKQFYGKAIRTAVRNCLSEDWFTVILAHKFNADGDISLPYLPNGFEEMILVKSDAIVLYRKGTGGKRQFVFSSTSPAIEAGFRDNMFAKTEVTVAGATGDDAVDAFISAVTK